MLLLSWGKLGGLPRHAELEQEGQAIMLLTCSSVFGFQLLQEEGVILCNVAPSSKSSICRGWMALPAVGGCTLLS